MSSLGDLTAFKGLLDLKDKMMSVQSSLYNINKLSRKDPTGKLILTEQPRINSKTVNFDYLSNLPVNTFG